MKTPFDYRAIRKQLKGLAKLADKAMRAEDERTRKSNEESLKRRIKRLNQALEHTPAWEIATRLRAARIVLNDPALGAWFDPLPPHPEGVARIVQHAQDQLPPPRKGRPATVVNPWTIHETVMPLEKREKIDRCEAARLIPVAESKLCAKPTLDLDALERAIQPDKDRRGKDSAAERAANRIRRGGAYTPTHFGAVAKTGLDKLKLRSAPTMKAKVGHAQKRG